MIKTASIDDILQNGIVGISGKTYKVESELSVGRKKAFDKWLVKFQSGIDPEAIVKEWDNGLAFFDKGKLALGIHHFVEKRNALTEIGTRTELCVQLCALFLNDPNEDAMAFSETLIIAKAKDFEGYSYNTFFLLLIGTLPSLIGSSKGSFPNTLQQEQSDKLKMISEPPSSESTA